MAQVKNLRVSLGNCSSFSSVFIFFFVLTLFGCFSLLGVDPHHDGIMYVAAQRIVDGRPLFKEIFCQYGDAVVYLQALILKLFGGGLAAIKLLTVVFYAGSAVLLDILWRPYLSKTGRWMLFVLFCGTAPFYLVPFHPWCSVYALFWALLALYMHRCGLQQNNLWEIWWLQGEGAACALCLLSRMPVGVSLAVVLIVSHLFWHQRRFRRVLFFVCGSIPVFLCSAIAITLHGAWRDYLCQVWGFVFRFAMQRGGITGGYGASINAFGECWRRLSQCFFPFSVNNWLLDMFFGVVPLVVLVVIYQTLKSRSTGKISGVDKSMFLTLTFFALVSWHQYYPVPCVRHLYWAAIPMFGVFVYEVEYLLKLKGRYLVIAGMLIFSAFLPILWRGYNGVGRLTGYASFPCGQGVLKYIRLNPSEYSWYWQVADIEKFLPESLKNREIFNYSGDALPEVLWHSKSSFRHPMFVNWGNIVYSDYQQQADDFIAGKKPVLFVNREIFQPGYFELYNFELRGEVYRFYIPQN